MKEFLGDLFPLVPIVLLVGGFVINDARNRGMDYIQTGLCFLISVFLFPVGLILYVIFRRRYPK